MKDTITYWKKRAWHEFSLYIRTQGSTNGYNTCVTCNTVYPIKILHAGHFIPCRHNSILFDERNVHPQCYHCNVGWKGNPRKYDAFMRKEYGDEVIKELERLDDIVTPMKWFEFKDIYEKYKELNERKA